MRRIGIGLAEAIGLLVTATATPASSPRPELMGYAAIHPVCVARGPGIDEALATGFCAAVTQALRARGHERVEPARIGDAALGQPRHIVLGFTLVAGNGPAGVGRIAISGLLSRVDRPSGALLPPPAEIVPNAADAATLAGAAGRLVGALGF